MDVASWFGPFSPDQRVCPSNRDRRNQLVSTPKDVYGTLGHLLCNGTFGEFAWMPLVDPATKEPLS